MTVMKNKDDKVDCSIRLTILVIVICVNVILSVFFTGGKFFEKSKPFPVSLEERINPNVAPAASLARLPGIGLAKAEQIVSYRQQVSYSGRDAKVFKDAADLDNVSGIGPKTTEDMRKFLKFE